MNFYFWNEEKIWVIYSKHIPSAILLNANFSKLAQIF